MNHLFHDLLSFLIFNFSIFSLGLGVYVFLKKVRSLLNFFFFLQAFSLSIFFLLALILYHDHKHYILSTKLYLIFEAFFLFSFFHFINQITKTFKSNVKRVLFLIPFLALIFIVLFFKDPVSYIEWKEQFLIFNFNFKSINMFLIILIDFFYILTAIIILIIHRRFSKSMKEKRVIDIMLFTSILSTILTITADIVITIIINKSLFITHFVILHVVIIEYIIVFYYRFLNFNVSNVIKEIFSNVSDFVILTDVNLHIIEISNNFKLRILNNIKNGVEISFDKLLLKKEPFLENINKAIRGDFNSFSINLIYTAYNNLQIVSDTIVTKIYDKFGDFVSFLIISKENKCITHFMTSFNITDRQMEIFQLAISGKTNEEIAEILNLKRRTVESHLFNIYFKLNINNKIELINIANKFGIYPQT